MFNRLVILCSAALILFSTACCHSNTTEIKEPSAFIQRLNSATVALVYETELKTQHTFCSGVFIKGDDGSDQILTAGHCLNAVAEDQGREDNVVGTSVHFVMDKESDPKNPFGEPTSVHLGKAIRYDEDADLGLIKVMGPIPEHAYVKVAKQVPSVGSKVFVEGMTYGIRSGAEAVVSAYVPHLEIGFESEFVSLSSSGIWHGNSGGPAVDDDGNLIGICSFSITHGDPSMFFFVAPKSIRKFLKQD